ncbi:MAG: hypothetical protein AB7G28_12370 [Pirellulales bacterium]
MGAFYGSVQVRTDDRSSVKSIAESVARALHDRILVGPVINGWVGLYPDMNGQSERVGAAIAQELDADVLQLVVHDDDIFAYWFYIRGKLVDSFWSAPGYFGEEHRTRDAAMAGNADAFLPILGEQVKQLSKLLVRGEERELFASDQLAEFANVLKISNALSAYEYLKAGEIEDIEGWELFEEVPAERVIAEKQTAREMRSKVNAERKQLQSDGVLLLRDERKHGGGPYGCAIDGGFVVAWPDHRDATVSFAVYKPPWEGARSLELDTSKHVTAVASDASKKRLAMSAGDRVHVWDVADGNWSHVGDIPESDLAISVAISADGKTVAHASRKQVVVTDIERNVRICAVERPAARQLAFHPDGEWLAVAGQGFGLIPLHSEANWRDIYVGGKKGSISPAALISKELQGIDIEEIKRMQRVEMEKMIKKLQTSSGRDSQRAMPDIEVQKFREAMERQMQEMQSQISEWAKGHMPAAPPQSNTTVWGVTFSRDGRWLFCGADGAIHVYDWAKLPRDAASEWLEPTFRCDIPEFSDDPNSRIRVWAIAEEVNSAGVVFGGSTGRLYRLDIETGQVRELVKLAGEAWVVDIYMSADGTAFGAAVLTMPFSEEARKRHERTAAWEIWSYTRLRA